MWSRRKVAGDVENQLGQSIGVSVNLALIARRHDRHIVGDRSISCIQRRDDRLLLSVRPQREIAERSRRHDGRIEGIGLRQALRR